MTTGDMDVCGGRLLIKYWYIVPRVSLCHYAETHAINPSRYRLLLLGLTPSPFVTKNNRDKYVKITDYYYIDAEAYCEYHCEPAIDILKLKRDVHIPIDWIVSVVDEIRAMNKLPSVYLDTTKKVPKDSVHEMKISPDSITPTKPCGSICTKSESTEPTMVKTTTKPEQTDQSKPTDSTDESSEKEKIAHAAAMARKNRVTCQLSYVGKDQSATKRVTFALSEPPTKEFVDKLFSTFEAVTLELPKVVKVTDTETLKDHSSFKPTTSPGKVSTDTTASEIPKTDSVCVPTRIPPYFWNSISTEHGEHVKCDPQKTLIINSYGCHPTTSFVNVGLLKQASYLGFVYSTRQGFIDLITDRKYAKSECIPPCSVRLVTSVPLIHRTKTYDIARDMVWSLFHAIYNCVWLDSAEKTLLVNKINDHPMNYELL